MVKNVIKSVIKKNMPQVIAHRGDSANYPENTLIAIEAAINKSALYVEFDIQLSMDGVPFVIHDKELERTAGQSGCVFEMSAVTLQTIAVGYEKKFANKFSHEYLASLSTVCEMLSRNKNVTAFVELKRASLRYFGREKVLQSVMDVLSHHGNNYILISYDHEVLAMSRDMGVEKIGWVCDELDESNKQIANVLRPDYMLTDAEPLSLTDTILWVGNWQWVLYEINEPSLAAQWAARGVTFIETSDVGLYTLGTTN